MVISLDSFKLPEDGVTVIILLEHIGDIIACEPVIRHALAIQPGRPVAWVTLPKYAGLLSAHPGLDFLLLADSLTQVAQWAEKLPPQCRVINLHFHQRPCPVSGLMVTNSNDPLIDYSNYLDYGGLLTAFTKCAGLTPLTAAPRFYIDGQVSIDGIAPPYVVFHCLSNSEDRNWATDKWRRLFDYFAGRNITVAEIGLSPLIARHGHPFYKDLTGELSFQQIALLIKKADFFIGVESGFAHLANALEKPGLVIMGVYGRWDNYIPYTGLYAAGHIVRHPHLPARYLAIEPVISRYEAMMSASPPAEPQRDIAGAGAVRPLNFPNAVQKLLLKIYRPLAKLDPAADYRLFTGNPRLYFMIPGQERPKKKIMRAILKLCGRVPSQVDF